VKQSHKERGAAMVEFALILPLLLLLILGLIEFGYRYERAARLNNAAFVAARSLSVHKTVSEATAAAQDADPGMVSSGATISASPSSDCTSGNVTVLITSTETSPTKFFGGSTFVVHAKGVARCDG
jgi:Flp pilus assembly protein TadG